MKNFFAIKSGIRAAALASIFFFSGFGTISAASPVVSLTFDDAWYSQYEYAVPVLEASGKKATLYVPTGLVGTPEYMSWANIVEMANKGWEIGGHTVTHAELPTLSYDQMKQEIEGSFEALEAHGFMPQSFASPYGAHDPNVVSEAASYYISHRGFHEIGLNSWPYNEYLLYVRQITNVTTLAEVQGWIDEAIATNTWLIIVFHEIMPVIAPEDTYAWTPTDLAALLDLFDTYGLEPKTVAEVLNMKDGIIPNSDFNLGLSEGWITDTPLQVVADTSGNGAVPTQASSIKLVASPTVEAHLSSPAVPVTFGTQYGLRIFADARNLASGELGFYLDEYDSLGTWVGWRYLGVATPGFTLDEAYTYSPSLVTAESVILRAYLSASSTGFAYLDNMTMFEEGEGDPLPVPNPVADLAVPLPMPNITFDAGISSGWKTDNSSQVSADTSGKGAAPSVATSVKISGGESPAHLFSPLVFINASTTYDVAAYVDTAGFTSGELGFFVDEYNANSAWISGQWLGQVLNGTVSEVKYHYVPSSSNVKSVSIQTYVTASSSGIAYVDNFTITDHVDTNTPFPATLPNTDFELGLSEGWATDNAEQVLVDFGGKGVSPTASSTIKFFGGENAAHLFSPTANIGVNTVYNISAHADTIGLESGELGFYVDEYDVLGTWISGKWVGMAENGVSGQFDFYYAPSSNLVRAASLQAYLTQGAEGEAYLDNFEINASGITNMDAPRALPLDNEDFELGISSGWTSDNMAQVSADISGNGALPNASSSVKFSSGSKAGHLFSAKFLVGSETEYSILGFANTMALSSGEFGFYVDEYDINGTWISGKWLGFAPYGTSSNFAYSYSPTSSSVYSASLQTYLTAGASGTAYVDNLRILAAGSIPDPISLPLPNSDFELGLSEGWVIDASEQVFADSSGNGTAPNASSSIKLLGGASAHLFSPRVSVSTTTAYTLSAFANTLNLTSGELGFYLDEYDENGNWISGGWLGLANLGTTSSHSFSYTPALDVVKSISFQIYLTNGALGEAYVDNVEIISSGI